MSCASPIFSQPSPPSLRMHNATNLLSPCRSNVDDPPFSFAFHRAHLPSSSSTSSSPASSPANARPVLTDILPHRYKNSPRSPLHRNPNLLSPRKCSKENWESTQRNIADNGGSIDSLLSPAGKAKRTDAENGTFSRSLSSFPGPLQPTMVDAASYMQLGSPTMCSSRQDRDNGASVIVCSASSSPSPRKRKRPAKLAIPELARLASFDKGKQFELPGDEPGSSEILSFEAPMFGVSCKKGRRDCMEDTHAAITNFQGKANQAFFGVFDGHGGKATAQFAAENLGRHIAAEIQNPKADEGSLEKAMEAGYLAIDSEIAEKGLDGGACSVSAYVKEGHLVVANAGDCMAVLCRDGKAEALSTLHRASDAEERQRVESLGGYVDCFHGVWRVQGTLAITRGLGDINMKRWISAEPEVRQLDITKGCEFLILASDGLWDKVSEQEAVDCIREMLQQGRDEQGLDILPSRPSKVLRKDNDVSISTDIYNGKSESTSALKIDACNKLIHKACKRGNLDDITVMVIPLADFAVSSTGYAKEEALMTSL